MSLIAAVSTSEGNGIPAVKREQMTPGLLSYLLYIEGTGKDPPGCAVPYSLTPPSLAHIGSIPLHNRRWTESVRSKPTLTQAGDSPPWYGVRGAGGKVCQGFPGMTRSGYSLTSY